MLVSFKKVAFIGFVGEGYGDFLNRLSQELNKENVMFEALFFGQHKHALVLDQKYLFDFYDAEYLPAPDELIGSAELLTGILQADFYIIWNGYHNVYAQLRNYLDKMNIPYLLSEYTSIQGLYHFDKGLHGEKSKVVLSDFNVHKELSLEKLQRYVVARYQSDNETTLKTMDELKAIKKQKKILLYLGIWDEAAGLNPYTTEETKNKLFPHYRSSYEALEALIKNIDTNTMLVIKLHPNDDTIDLEKVQKLVKENSNLLLVDKNVSSEALIKISDITATMTSTLSIYAAYYEIPLLLMGVTYLSDSGYAYQLDDKENLKQTIESAFAKENWDQRRIAREQFFNNFIFHCNTFTVDQGLMDLGAKSIDSLVEKIYDVEIEGFQFNWNKKIDFFNLLICNRPLNVCEKMIQERDQYIQELLRERQEIIENYEQKMTEAVQAIKSQDKLVDERDRYIKELERKLNG